MSEALEIKRDGAKATSNSGRGQNQKGDSILDGLITIDYKEYKKSFGVTKDVWAKISMDAIRNGHTVPALKLILGDESDRLRLFVISEDFFMEMYEAWKVGME